MKQSNRTRQPFFYGWWVVLAASLALFMYGGAGIWIFGLFIMPMGKDLGWSQSTLNLGLTLRLALSMAGGLVTGPLMDRRGWPRLVMALGGLLGGASLLATSRLESPAQFYLWYGLVGGVAGACYGEVVTETLVAKWFVRRRALALAIFHLGGPGPGVVLVPLVQAIISTLGWRTAWMALGLGTWLLVVPFSLLLARRSPEDLGLAPDGGAASAAVNPKPEARSWTLAQAIKDPTLWLLVLTFNIVAFGQSAISVHLVPYLTGSRGFSPTLAATTISVMTLVSVLTKVSWGYLAGRIRVNLLLGFAYLTRCLALLLLLFLLNKPTVFLFAVLYGYVASATVPLWATLWANFYGRESLGSIRGFVSPLSLVSFAGAPLAVAYVFDITGGYQAAFLSFIVVFFLGSILLALARPPRRREGG